MEEKSSMGEREKHGSKREAAWMKERSMEAREKQHG